MASMAAFGLRRSACVRQVARTCAPYIKPYKSPFLGRKGHALELFQPGGKSVIGGAAANSSSAKSPDAMTPAEKEEKLRALFHILDEDKSGALDVDEMKTMFTKPSGVEALKGQPVEQALKKFDANNDGVLQFEEFSAFWKQTVGDAGDKILRESVGDPLASPTPQAKPTVERRAPGAFHVAVIGAGVVGSNTAFALMTSDVGQGKLTLTDVAEELVKGQVMDLEDLGVAWGGVSAANLQQAGQADVIIISAGRGVREGETRLDCLMANHGIMQSIVNGMQPINPNATIVVLANPCDILAYYVWQFSGLPCNQVIGSGTLLDTVRLRTLLSESIGAHVDSIQCDVLGEHGDSQFAATSLATVGGIPLTTFAGFSETDVALLVAQSSKKGPAIRVRKGATAFGIATSTRIIVESILKDQRKVLPVSIKVPDAECYLSLPCVVGFGGVKKILDVRPHLNPAEKEKWDISVDTMVRMML